MKTILTCLVLTSAGVASQLSAETPTRKADTTQIYSPYWTLGDLGPGPCPNLAPAQAWRG